MNLPPPTEHLGDIQASRDEISRLLRENCAIGTPIETAAGITVIPVSRVSVGFASGSAELGRKRTDGSFGGGSGTGISIQPIAFLTVSQERGAELIPVMPSVGAQTADRIASLIETTPDLIKKIKGALSAL